MSVREEADALLRVAVSPYRRVLQRRGVNQMPKVRAHVLISGRVQGVMFRGYTVEAAYERGVRGWVRNTRDRRVEALLEGERKDVEDMIRWCHRGSPFSDVTAVDVQWLDYTGEFPDFGVRY